MTGYVPLARGFPGTARFSRHGSSSSPRSWSLFSRTYTVTKSASEFHIRKCHAKNAIYASALRITGCGPSSSRCRGFLGDDGKLNDNMLMHILSPYPEHRRAVTDCLKLACTQVAARRAVLIYGFEHEEWPLEPALHAFEVLAR
jgi:hypothetical protein